MQTKDIIILMIAARMFVAFLGVILYIIGIYRHKKIDKDKEEKFFLSFAMIVVFLEILLVLEMNSLIHLITGKIEGLYLKFSTYLYYIIKKNKKGKVR